MKGNHRDRKLLNLAHRLHECTVQIPGVCRGYSVDGLEPAHSNQQVHGRGKDFKSHDVFHAAACGACHHELDHGTKLNRVERNALWQRGHERTLLEYFRRGWVKVSA